MTIPLMAVNNYTPSPARVSDTIHHIKETTALVDLSWGDGKYWRVCKNWGGREDMMKIRLYRALRDDERNCQLLGMEPTNSRCTTTAVDHVLNGSQSHFYSPYISTTKDYDVALFFAAKAHHQRGASVVRIAVLDIVWI